MSYKFVKGQYGKSGSIEMFRGAGYWHLKFYSEIAVTLLWAGPSGH